MHFNTALSMPDRPRYLLSQLSSDLSAREAAAAPQKLYDVNLDSWRRFLLGIQTMQKFPGLSAEEAQTIRRTLGTTNCNARVPWLNMLANLDLRIGNYVEAEGLARQVLSSMQDHEKLARNSHRAFGTTRIIIQSVWKQGGSEEDEARRLIEEAFVLIDGMEGSKFPKYQNEEREMLQDLKAKMESGGSSEGH